MNKRNLVLITGANKIGQSGFPSTSLPPELHIRGYFSMQNHNNYHNHHNNNNKNNHNNNHIYSNDNTKTSLANITAMAHNKLASLSTYIRKANCSNISSITLLSGGATDNNTETNTEAPMQLRTAAHWEDHRETKSQANSISFYKTNLQANCETNSTSNTKANPIINSKTDPANAWLSMLPNDKTTETSIATNNWKTNNKAANTKTTMSFDDETETEPKTHWLANRETNSTPPLPKKEEE